MRLRVHAQARFTSSCVISSVSTATAVLVELNDGPVHFDGQALVKFQRIFSAPVSSSSTIEPFLRSVLPSITVCRHFHSSSESVMPRLSVMRRKLVQPGQLAHVIRVGALAVIDAVGARIQAADFLKAGLGDAVDLHQKIEATIGIMRLPVGGMRFLLAVRPRCTVKPGHVVHLAVGQSAQSCHGTCAHEHLCHARAQLTSVVPARWMIRTTMNSAGASGARPISVTTCPTSRSSGGLVSASHFT